MNPPPASPTSTMRSARLHGIEDLRLDVVPVPSPAAGELLVSIEANGVCATDARKYRVGVNDGEYPFNPGHEWVGRVAGLGDGVVDWSIGERVYGDTYGGYDGCGLQNAVGGVFIDGGEVTNQTIISVSADGGTAIADASGGDGNFASTGGNAGNGGSITSSAGNGGVANASANGGVISLGDINSGGNAGNAIGVGDTVAGPGPICCAPPPYKPIPVYPGKPGQAPAPGTMSPGKVVIVTALPSTGSGMEIGSGGEAVALTALAAGLASIAMRRRVVCAERVRVMG